MRVKILILVLVMGTLALYWPTRHFDFLYYDDPYFVANPGVLAGLSWRTIEWAMTDVVFNDWHPVTLLSFLFTHQLFGINQGAEHLVNVEFHAANAVLLFLLLLRLTGATWRSGIVAAIFAWHPQRVESVCWVAERRDVLFAFFMLLSLLCYVEHTRRQMKDGSAEVTKPGLRLWDGPYVLALIFFVLSFLSKGMVATLPFLLLLLDFWPLQRFSRASVCRIVMEKIPFFALTFFLSALTFWIHKEHGDYRSLQDFGIVERLQDATLSYYKYLAQFFWPSNLALIYPYPKSYELVQALPIGLLLLAVTALCVIELPRRPYLAVGWAWYLGMMFPVTGLVQFGTSPVADRFTYIPLIGPVIGLVWMISEWADAKIWRKCLTVSMVVSVLTVCVILSHTQIMFWRNTITVFQHTVDVTPDNACAQFPFGVGLEKDGKLRQAAIHFRIGLILEPDYYHHYEDLHLASVLAHLGQYREASKHFNAALLSNPDWTDALKGYAWMLATCPDSSIRNGPHAVELARHACELTHYRKAVFVGTLGAAFAETGQFDQAMLMSKKAIKLANENGETILVEQNQRLMKIYMAHKAYHEQSKDDQLLDLP
jgi:protein O-mannosyl-transferase